jgi:16S rRNA C1402 (ribose-2'-O) methylase RsmI
VVLEDVRVAVGLDPYVPALTCDARERESVKEVLITLVEHVLTSVSAAGSAPLSDPGEADDPGAISSAR